MVVIKLAGAGKAVKTGDLLVQFDSQTQDKAALDKKAEYEDLVRQIIQKRAEHDAARVKDESELTQARNAVKKFELETLEERDAVGVLAEKNNQDLAEARSKVEALEEGFKLKRSAAGSELRILEIKRDRARAAMDHALENSKGMSVISPLDGLVVPKLTWRGNGPADIQEGDEMWPGAPVLQVVIAHPNLKTANEDLASAIREAIPGSLVFVCGPSGVGKTTLRLRTEQRITNELLTELNSDPGRLPVVAIEAISPEVGNFNWKEFYTIVLEGLDEPCANHKVKLPPDENDAEYRKKTNSRNKRPPPRYRTSDQIPEASIAAD